MSEAKLIIPEGYEQKPEDMAKRLHTKPTGGRQMKLGGTVKCPKTSCGRSVSFALRTHDASKTEFITTCKRCKTKIALVFFVGEWVEEKTAFEMIEKAQPKEEVKESATSQLPTPTGAIPGKPNEDKDEPSGDEQDKASLPEEYPDATKDEDPFAGLE